MWFGILPGNQELSLPTFTVGTNEDAFATLQQLDSDGVAVQHLRQMQSRHPGYLHGFCDIVPMVAPWLCQPDSRVNCYPQPLGPQNTLGLTWYCSAYGVFYDQLVEYNERKGTIQTRKIAKNYEDLKEKHGVEWDGISPSLDDRSELNQKRNMRIIKNGIARTTWISLRRIYEKHRDPTQTPYRRLRTVVVITYLRMEINTGGVKQ
ncbi:unnamed protein product [Alternaria alternata]